MKLNKENKGITLVALVITIIILLILAGITINSLIGSELFENTKLAKERYKNAEKLENETLGDYENKIGEYIDGSRQSGNVPVGTTVLWSCENDEKGLFTYAGRTDGTSERTIAGNVNDYDVIVVDAGYPPNNTAWPDLQSLYISKPDFNEKMRGMLTFSSTFGHCNYAVKIDSDNNKIILVESAAEGSIVIRKVIGIKY